MKIRNHAYNIREVFGCPGNTKGEVGIEIETIGKNLPMEFKQTKLWAVHPDASIKPRVGEGAAEYVFSQPVGRPKVEQALDELLTEFKEAGSTIAEDRISNSVHVHINAQPLTVMQVYTWLATYFIFEELLVRWAGPHRVGNLFCLRARDAEGLIKMLSDSAKRDQYGNFGMDTYRYAAVNVVALQKFGSLEFRALRGTCDKQTIMTWVDVLLAIKDKALEYKNPTDVLADFSRRSPFGFANHVLTPALRGYMMTQPDFVDVLYNGARLTQDFAFSTPWYDGPPIEKPVATKRRASSQNILDEMVTATQNIDAWGDATIAPGGLNYAPTWAFTTASGVTSSAQPAPAHTPFNVDTIFECVRDANASWRRALPGENHDVYELSQTMKQYMTSLSAAYEVGFAQPSPATGKRFLVIRTYGGTVLRRVAPTELIPF